MVREKVPVCLPRDGNGTGTREAIRLTGRDGSPQFLGGKGSWNGSGTVREIGRLHSREISREHNREIGREHCRESVRKQVGNVVGIWSGDAVQNGWEHDGDRGLETTVKKRELTHRVLFIN